MLRIHIADESSAQGGGGALPIMAYMGRLCPKGVPFSGFRYIKGLIRDFTSQGI